MSVDVWEPGNDKQESTQVSDELLEQFVEAGHFLEAKVDLTYLESYGIASESQVMSLGVDSWSATEVLPIEDLIALIRLFTLVEVLPGWEAGAKSPVIALVKLLKRRNAFTADIRKWIKQNTDNRYLPYGSAL